MLVTVEMHSITDMTTKVLQGLITKRKSASNEIVALAKVYFNSGKKKRLEIERMLYNIQNSPFDKQIVAMLNFLFKKLFDVLENDPETAAEVVDLYSFTDMVKGVMLELELTNKSTSNNVIDLGKTLAASDKKKKLDIEKMLNYIQNSPIDKLITELLGNVFKKLLEVLETLPRDEN